MVVLLDAERLGIMNITVQVEYTILESSYPVALSVCGKRGNLAGRKAAELLTLEVQSFAVGITDRQ